MKKTQIGDVKNVTTLASYVAEHEGLTKEVSMGNIREIVSIISDMAFAEPDVLVILAKNGLRRSKKKK